MKGKKIILHVGMPKTGTTSLQNALWQNREKMAEEKGIFYPDLWLNSEGIAQHNLALLFENEEANTTDLISSFDLFWVNEKIQEVLISSESFTNSIAGKSFDLFYEFLSLLSKSVDVKVVIVLREYSSFVESMYLHSIKVGNVSNDFSTYLKDRLTWCDRFFERLALIRDSGQIDLKVFPYDGESVIDKFSKLLGFQLERKLKGRTNQKLTAKGQLLLYKMNDYLPEHTERRRELIFGLEQGKIQFQDDSIDYTLFHENEFRLLSLISRNYAKQHSIPEYFSASKEFDSYLSGKKHIDLDNMELSKLDLLRVNEYLYK